MEFQMQLLHVHARKIPHLDMLEMLPTTLVQRTQIGSVSRHRLQMNPLCASGRQEFLDSAPPMDRRTIPDHQQLLPRLYQQVLQKDRKTTLSRLFSDFCRTKVYSFPAGVTPAITDRWSRLNRLSTNGVCPFGP